MSEEKKDLTSIIVYSKKLQDSGEAPPVPEGSMMEEIPIEKINDFESLDDYAKANPMPDPQEAPHPSQAASAAPAHEAPTQEKHSTTDTQAEQQQHEASQPQFDSTPESPPNGDQAFLTTPETSPEAHAPGHDPSSDPFATPSETHSEAQAGADDPFATTVNSSSDPFSSQEASTSSEFQTTPPSPNPEEDPFATSSTDSSSESAFDFSETSTSSQDQEQAQALSSSEASPHAPTEAAESFAHEMNPPAMDQQETQPPAPSTPSAPTPSPKPPTPATKPQSSSPSPTSQTSSPSASTPNKPPTPPLEKVRQFAENHPSVAPKAVPASFPFSVLIEGPLTPAEQEKLMDLLTRENMGIREMDMEPQLQAGRVLIPRVSEYAAVLLVQALRNISAKMRVGPSDQIFSSQAAQKADPQTPTEGESQEQIMKFALGPEHLAEKLPMTQESSLPNMPSYSVIDTLSATATVKAKWVAHDQSYEYQSLIEALQKELKYKAFHRGAQAIVSFRIQLTPISASQDYRLLALGTAIKSLDQSSMTGHEPPSDAYSTSDPYPES